VLIVLLVLLALRVFRGRHESEPPRWMGRLQDASPRFSFVLGFLLLGVFPTDIITSVTAGLHLSNHGDAWADGLVFVAVTLVLLLLPALLVLALGRRAHVLLPKVRDWMNTHSWIISEFVIAFFIAIQINSLLG
jgi:hypothetical protein